MKITKKRLKYFEKQQKERGTETALLNIIWEVATELLHDIGVEKVTTKWKK